MDIPCIGNGIHTQATLILYYQWSLLVTAFISKISLILSHMPLTVTLNVLQFGYDRKHHSQSMDAICLQEHIT